MQINYRQLLNTIYSTSRSKIGYMLVEAKNSAPHKNGRLGQRELVAQPATKDQWVRWPVLFLGGGEREEEGGDETRIATEESQRQREGRTLVVL